MSRRERALARALMEPSWSRRSILALKGLPGTFAGYALGCGRAALCRSGCTE